MNKALLGLLVLSALLVSQTLAADVECKNHPAFVKARQYIKDAVKDIAKGGEKSENLLKAFESATPETLSAEDLGVCAQFANQKTCCNKNIVKLLDRAAFSRTGALNKRNSAIKKAVSVAFKILKRKNCPKAQNLSITDLYNNANLTKLKDLLAEQKTCKVNFAKSIAQITRGAMCSICAGVEKVTDYFVDGKLKISEESAQTFQTAAEAAITCVANNIATDKLKAVVDQIVAEYVNDQCADKNLDITLLTNKVFEKALVKPKKDNGDSKCAGTVIFAANEECESGLEGSSTLETDAETVGNKRFLEDNFRILAAEDAQISSSGGVNIYISSTTDNNITEDGSVNINFDDVDDENSAYKLAFTALISLVVLLL